MTTHLVRTPIIPERVTIAKAPGRHELDYEALCVFAAAGFFLEGDCYFRDEHALQPASEYELDENGVIASRRAHWRWHATPEEMTLDQAADRLGEILERAVSVGSGTSVLAISGGLDSRTLAAALGGKPARGYSYGFAHETIETEIAARIAAAQRFPFEEMRIEPGYLWRVIAELAELNRCESDFTHPRQMAVIDRIERLGDRLVLGHWGDVLFGNFGLPAALPFDALVEQAMAKIVKRGGAELSRALWQAWGLAGDFDSYLRERVRALLSAIEIADPNARLRAFKSMYWAPRWTTVNIGVFQRRRPVVLPYYSDEMCKFVTTVPEKLLAGRQIQIAYIKRHSPALARIPWQSFYPLDLYTYPQFGAVRRLPGRAIRRAVRFAREALGRPGPVTRNWEIQFVGEENDARLCGHLFGDSPFQQLVPRDLVMRFYKKFKLEDRLTYAHPVSMLLTLSMFARSEASRRGLRDSGGHVTVTSERTGEHTARARE